MVHCVEESPDQRNEKLLIIAMETKDNQSPFFYIIEENNRYQVKALYLLKVRVKIFLDNLQMIKFTTNKAYLQYILMADFQENYTKFLLIRYELNCGLPNSYVEILILEPQNEKLVKNK